MPKDEGIAATLAGALLQVRAIRGTMPDEREAVRIYFVVLKELRKQSSETQIPEPKGSADGLQDPAAGGT